MNKKWFVGKKVSDFSQFNVEGPISGITLLVDDETEYSAGDDSGIVWEITNPYGTQQMANDILNAVKGKEYRGFHADNAVLDPSAELGDGVNVNGGYYMLGYKNVTFGPGHMAEISAPNNGELNHEYPYKSKEERTFSRKLADMRSSITKTREQILLEVSKTYATNESVSSSIQQTADSILSTVSATYATGESVSKVEQTANKINWLVKSGTSESDFSLTDRAIKLVSDTIDLSGFVTFSSLETQGKTTINGSNITTGTISADRINLTGAITFDDLNQSAKDIINGKASSADVKTQITSTLLSSPNIAGGKFYDINQEKWMVINSEWIGAQNSWVMTLNNASFNGDNPLFGIFEYHLSTGRNTTGIRVHDLGFIEFDPANKLMRLLQPVQLSGITNIGPMYSIIHSSTNLTFHVIGITSSDKVGFYIVRDGSIVVDPTSAHGSAEYTGASFHMQRSWTISAGHTYAVNVAINGEQMDRREFTI